MTQYLNNAHSARRGGSSATMTTGEPYIAHPSPTGICGRRTCIRCGAPRAPTQLVPDVRVRHQFRCAGGCNQGASS